MTLLSIADELSRALDLLSFARPVTHVVNPLAYAREPYRRYVERWGEAPKEVVLLGMNPGPFGMAQTGVPFGEVAHVRDWLGIRGEVGRPPGEHPKRPIQGFDCPRSEVSGARLWGWAAAAFGTPERFFRRFFVANYCPLVFFEASGRNFTPDRLPAAAKEPLLAACDQALVKTLELLRPRLVVGVGKFAEGRARQVLAAGRGKGRGIEVGGILHPSPASPAANRGWAEQASRQLAALGVELAEAGAGEEGAAGGKPLGGRDRT